MSDETRQLFTDFFNSGMTPAAAMSLHESKLMVRTLVFRGCGTLCN